LEHRYLLAKWCSGLKCRRLLVLEVILLSSALPQFAILLMQQNDVLCDMPDYRCAKLTLVY
jgi:hypothetical protein